MTLDLLPMLLLSLLLMLGGGDVTTVKFVLEGEHDAIDAGPQIVGGATVTVPDGAETSGPIHVIAGRTTIAGRVDGDITLIAGTLIVAETATITGTLQHVGGTLTVSPAAKIGRRTSLDLVTAETSAVQRVVPVIVITLVLALIGVRSARRKPQRLATVGDALTGHPLVAVTVGLLVAVTSISVFVFMAFTLVLLPVALLGLAGGLLALGYGIIALGHIAGRHLPIVPPRWATAAGVVVVMALLQVLGLIPGIGDLLAIGVLLAGLGGVVLTYFGLQRFVPATLPE